MARILRLRPAGIFAVVRATRFGLSAAIDAHGRLRAQQSTSESAQPFLLAALPAQHITTLYTSLGNLVLPPLLAIVAAALGVLVATRARARGGLAARSETDAVGAPRDTCV